MKKSDVTINYRVAAPLALLFVIFTLIFPRTAKFGYDYRKGSPWEYETLIAQFDFPILKTDEQLREERSRNKTVIVPYYRYRQDVVDNSRKAADELPTKKDKKNHGIGLKVVRSIVEKYDGYVNFEQKGGEFIASVMLSLG